jgi:hypothetical protein
MLMTLLGADTTLPSIDNTLAPVTTFVQPVGDADLLTTTAPPAAAVSLSRDTRQAVDNGAAAAAAAAAAVTSLFDDAAAQTTSGPNFFKGVIQDVQLSNGANVKRIVKLFELDFAEKVDVELSLGRVTAVAIKKGVVSDNTCRTNPCQNDGICHITWNDYRCEWQAGFKGDNCEEREYCYWVDCPAGSTCNTLRDGLWHTVAVRPLGGLILGEVDGVGDSDLALDGNDTLDLFDFIQDSETLVGSSHAFAAVGLYNVEDDDSANTARIPVDIHSRDSLTDYFRGCLGEVRIGGILLPFYTEPELVNNTVANR